MKKLFMLCFVLAACGGSKVTEPPPPPVVTGTIFFALSNCQNYLTAEYVVDSTSVGVEPIVSGVLSKGYTVPSGIHSAKAVVRGLSIPQGLWTYNDRLTVPANGNVTANLKC